MSSKYHAKKVKEDGYVFDSIAEYERYKELRLLLRAGAISSLEVHPTFLLQGPFTRNGHKHKAIYYEADFLYDGTVEDVKGVQTDVFLIKAKLFLKIYPNPLIISKVKKRHGKYEFESTTY